MDFFRDIVLTAAVQSGGGSAGPSYGPELWVQPAFAASTGVTLTDATITGGQLRFEAAGSLMSASATALDTLVASTVHYSIDIVANDLGAGLMVLAAGGTTLLNMTALGPGTYTGDVAITAATQIIEILEEDGFVTATFDNLSVKRVL